MKSNQCKADSSSVVFHHSYTQLRLWFAMLIIHTHHIFVAFVITIAKSIRSNRHPMCVYAYVRHSNHQITVINFYEFLLFRQWSQAVMQCNSHINVIVIGRFQTFNLLAVYILLRLFIHFIINSLYSVFCASQIVSHFSFLKKIITFD